MRILQGNEAVLADQFTLEKQGITSVDLMNRAARIFTEAFLHRFPNPGKGLVVCGPGNNGGDGLVMARLLHPGREVSVFVPSVARQFSPDFIAQQKALPEGVEYITGSVAELERRLPSFDWVAEALFGSGLNRPLEGDWKEVVQALNGFRGLRISIDSPAGLQETMPSGAVAFEADWVGTFHSPKLAFLFPSHQKYVPEFQVLDIGLSLPAFENSGIGFNDAAEMARLLRFRRRFSHKGTYGHGLLLVGSEGKMGAAVLAAKAMLRSGVGLASVYGPRCGRDVLQTAVPEAMFLADPEKELLADLPPLGPYAGVGIGPGIGVQLRTGSVLRRVLERSVHPIVLDADALNLLAENKSWLEKIPRDSILTPHPKEFERLVGRSRTDAEVFAKAKAFARKYSCYLVLKGGFTVICSPSGEVWFNSTGNPGMATGGSGDVLTGILTGLLTQGYTPTVACRLGVYLHGLAGDLAAEALGQASLVAGDLVEYLPAAFRELESIRTKLGLTPEEKRFLRF